MEDDLFKKPEPQTPLGDLVAKYIALCMTLKGKPKHEDTHIALNAMKHALAGKDLVEIEKAFEAHIKSSRNFPFPTDILKLMDKKNFDYDVKKKSNDDLTDITIENFDADSWVDRFVKTPIGHNALAIGVLARCADQHKYGYWTHGIRVRRDPTPQELQEMAEHRKRDQKLIAEYSEGQDVFGFRKRYYEACVTMEGNDRRYIQKYSLDAKNNSF